MKPYLVFNNDKLFRQIDYDDANWRSWARNHMHWGLHNGVKITFVPVVEWLSSVELESIIFQQCLEPNKIYLVKRHDTLGYDEMLAAVVSASNEEAARDLAAARAQDEGRNIWFGAETTCTEVLTKQPAIILTSIRNG